MLFNLFKKEELITNSEKIKNKLKPVVLVILDGFGISPISEGNAVWHAKMPNFDKYQKKYPKTLIHSSGNEVGLPYGEFGNSEVGHLNIGSGRIAYQPLLRVTNEIEAGRLNGNKAMDEIKKHLKKTGGALHLMGLISAGGVHSHIEHIESILEWCEKEKIKNIFLDLFTDGRDSPPHSAEDFINMIKQKAVELNLKVRISSVSGRYFAMDRDGHWNRIKEAYETIIGKGKNKSNNIDDLLKETYKNKKSDEFVEPTMLTENKRLIGPISDGDALLFFNIRSDRAKEITSAFIDKKFKNFTTKKFKNLLFVSFTEYDPDFDIPVVFPEEPIKNTLSEILSHHGKKQLHIAETEKYAHVTYFFSGGKEKPFPGETRIIIPSPKVATFDKKPEMSAGEITERVVAEIRKDKFDFIVLNFANPDMLGHTGNIKATIKGLEFVDACLGKIVNEVLEKNGAVVITSDHGNAEMMINTETGEKDTEHNIFPSPLIVIEKELENKKETKLFKDLLVEATGSLSDVAPTILQLMKIKPPSDITGISLLDSLK